MTTEPSNINAYFLADHIVDVLAGLSPPGLVLSIDFGGSMFETIAENAARLHKHDFVGTPSRIRHRAQLQGRNHAVRATDVLEEPVLFGLADGTRRVEDERETLEYYGLRLDEAATRSIDSWAAGRPTICHLHFGDPEFTLDQMAGAAETMSQHRPMAAFYTADVNKQALLSQLERLDYQIIDLCADYAQSPAAKVLASFAWIAVPAEKRRDIKGRLSEQRADGTPQFSEWQDLMERNAPARQHRSRSVFGLQANVLPLTRKIDAPDILAEDDCYAAEFEAKSAWRWLGPRSRTRLTIPCPLPGIYEIELLVVGSHLIDGLGRCRILVDGREVCTTINGTETGTIRFIGQLDPTKYLGYMSVDVISPGGISRLGDESRGLRLSIQSISVAPWR